MLKRVFKETSHSMKRNPVKVVLIGLIMLIASNIIFASLMIGNEMKNKVNLTENELSKYVELVYIDPELEAEFNFETYTDKPIIYKDELFEVDDLYMHYAMRTEYLARLKDNDYKRDKYTLGLFPGSNFEIRTNYSTPYYPDFISAGDDFFEDGTYDAVLELLEGTKDIGMLQHGVLINDEYAKKHNLELEDKIIVFPGEGNIELIIKGIFKNVNENLNDFTLITDSTTLSYIIQKMNMDTWSGDPLLSDIMNVYNTKEDADRFMDYHNESLISSNLKFRNATSNQELLINELNLIRIVSYVIAIITSIVAIVLINMVLKYDIKENHEDILQSIYREDVKKLRKTYILEISIISLFMVLISLYTAPAVIDTVGENIILENITVQEIGEDSYLSMEENVTDFLNGSSSAFQIVDNFDYYISKNLEFNSDVLSIVLLVVLASCITTGSVMLATRKLTNKKEVIN